jgi:hypothetical protein
MRGGSTTGNVTEVAEKLAISMLASGANITEC